MPITRRSEYGLRAMVLLGEQLGDERLSASELARREQIPVKFLEQILRDLRESGLVESRAGARGGYRLVRAPDRITVGEIVRAVDGPLDPGPGAGPPDAGDPEERLWPLWRRLGQAMREVLDGTRLSDLTFTSAPPASPRAAPEDEAPADHSDDPRGLRRRMWWI
ncbi:MAG: Rrf2 family transcriptional regulator [Alphaproteobacteria bacterium]|nr:Rrf2 family transcriptional regulator [Alphaproteobacteria bacterium]